MIDFQGATITSATLTLAGQKGAFIIDNSVGGKLALLTVMGTGGTITNGAAAIATVNAAASTGGVSFDESLVAAPITFAFTGAATGINKLKVTQAQLDALTSGAQLNGGNTTGTNTLDVTTGLGGPFAATDYTHINATTNFQVLDLDNIGAGTVVDASKRDARGMLRLDLEDAAGKSDRFEWHALLS